MSFSSLQSLHSEADNEGFQIFVIFKPKEGLMMALMSSGQINVEEAKSILETLKLKEQVSSQTGPAITLPLMPAPLK